MDSFHSLYNAVLLQMVLENRTIIPQNEQNTVI